MWQRIKNWFIAFSQLHIIASRVDGVELDFLRQYNNEIDKSFNLQEFIQNKLGSINLEDVRDIVKLPEDIKVYEAGIASIFKDHLEPTIKKLIITQEQFMARQVKDMDQLSFGRGTVNGLLLILEEFESAWKNHQATITPEKEPDQTTFFPSSPTLESLQVHEV